MLHTWPMSSLSASMRARARLHLRDPLRHISQDLLILGALLGPWLAHLARPGHLHALEPKARDRREMCRCMQQICANMHENSLFSPYLEHNTGPRTMAQHLERARWCFNRAVDLRLKGLSRWVRGARSPGIPCRTGPCCWAPGLSPPPNALKCCAQARAEVWMAKRSPWRTLGKRTREDSNLQISADILGHQKTQRPPPMGRWSPIDM